MYDRQHVAACLKAAREAKGLSAAYASAQLRMSVNRLIALEQGSEATAQELYELSALYNISLKEIVAPLPEGFSEAEIVHMFLDEKITGPTAAGYLSIDILDFRALLDKYA